MKLFTRYNRINLFATVIVFLFAGISFYFLLRYVLLNQVDEDLKIEQREVETYAGKYHQLPEIIQVRDQQTIYKVVDKDGGKRKFSTRKSSDKNEKEDEFFRELVFYLQTNGRWYEVSVGKSLEGTDMMIQLIVTITLITILLILIISVLINRVLLKKLWRPFYDALAAMRQFELGKNKQPDFPATNIDEFMLMNETLKQATAKADQDYLYLKEFTENASHELQTPLAIIRSKLDILIQDENLSEPQSKTVHGAYEAIQRLARLNQGLLLLAKIENGQYATAADVNMAAKIKSKMIQFEEMIREKNITVSTMLDESALIKMNPELTDIILNNLFSNAIKYNVSGGSIQVFADQNRLELCNTAAAGALDENKLFKRFSKSGHAKEGIGLGLAIVRQAAAYAGFEASYSYKDRLHHFKLLQL